MILDDIVIYKRKQLEEKKLRLPLKKLMARAEACVIRRRDFKRALMQHSINIIAEIKKASPSKGILCEHFDPVHIAHLYERADACAISVLTEEHFFKGKLAYLRHVRQATARPILRKDFIIDCYQLYETVLAEADAVLLIASLLTEEELASFMRTLADFSIDALVEVHTEQDLKKAVACGAHLIGINNRNLYTFDVDLEVTVQLMRHIPKGITVVSESGIATNNDIQRLRSFGVHAFLIGERIMIADNIVNTIHQLRGAPTL